ncbi:hypothetical protein [Clostridium perfringens]|uniref:Uncharacterized protein n=2 Tax=Clostridium perfringens TaxID=1502 RepID=A0A8H9QYC7_CLOPF|nr:hypothetical protein [Clostridium perfringens]MDU7943369.1 hypothetical protein [Streptococcus salivarius]MDU7977657.1 hypothetical protein [Clostridioides difficile]EDT15863.1 hypothetical protein AC3_A0237 [Clostridium perfringens E str. JGS1987]MBI6024495.1 hypothetical protein [Clostridium perfringens]MBI6048518.1 hypothetical protein [Clostridium perfringens]
MIKFECKNDLIKYLNINENEEEKNILFSQIQEQIDLNGLDFTEIPIHLFEIEIKGIYFNFGLTYKSYDEILEVNYWIEENPIKKVS